MGGGPEVGSKLLGSVNHDETEELGSRLQTNQDSDSLNLLRHCAQFILSV